MDVWRPSFTYTQESTNSIKRLNVYAGGTFGSESVWDYSEEDDTWTVRFIDAQCEEWDTETETGDFTFIGKISFTMKITRLGE